MKNKLFALSLLTTLGVALAWCGNYISKKEAQNAAILDAGFNRNEVVFIETELDREYGIYDVEFIANGKYRYEYEVNARNGEIIVDMMPDFD